MELFTPKEVAEQLKVAEYTVGEWIREGKLRAVRVGKKFWRVRKSDLEAFLIRREGDQNESAHQNAS